MFMNDENPLGGFALSVWACVCVSAGELIHFVRQFNDSLHMENGMNATESANMPLTNASSRDGDRVGENERVGFI